MKYIYRTLFIFALLMLMGLIGAHFYFSPTRLQGLLQPRLQKALQRNVTFDHAQLDYGLEPSIALANLTIQDRPGFSAQPFIKTKQAHIQISPLAFLMGQNRIGTLHLEEAQIRITINHKGEYNTSDLMRSKQMRVPINQLQLTNTTLFYHNLKLARQTTVHIQNANLLASQSIDGIHLTGDTNIQNIATQTKNDVIQGIATQLTFETTYHPKTQNITIKKMALNLGPILAHLTGQFNWHNQTIDLKTKNETLDFERIQKYLIENNYLSPQATLSGESQLDLHLSGNTWPPNISGKLKATNIAIADPNRVKNPIINGEIHIATDAKTLRLQTLSFQSGLSDIRLSGVISNLTKRPHLSFAWASPIIDIDGFLPPTQPEHAQWGITTAAHATTGTKKSALISLLQSLDMDGSIHADSLRVHNTWIQNFRATTHAQDGGLNIKPITGQTHQGALNSSLSLTTHEQGARLESNLSLINAQAHPLLNQTLGWRVPLYGSLTLTTRAEGTLDTTLTYVPTTTKANGRITMQAGKLVQWDLLQNNLQSVEQLGLLTADEVPLQNATFIFNLTGHTLALNGTQLTAANMACRVHGSGDLNGDLNYAIDVDVPPSRIQFGGFNLGALLGGRTIPVRIHMGGTSRAPKITAGLR